jgi:alanine racemase
MMLHYDIQTLANITNAKVLNNENISINQVFIDSRNFFGEADRMFIAIKGPSNDGHNYIADLIKEGCRLFLIDKKHEQLIPQDIVALVVEDTMIAMQQIARHHRRKFKYPMIGITGSNGKTIVKEWLYHFLKNKYNIVRSPKSYNSQIGVSLSLLQLTKSHTLGIIEAGISMPNEMSNLQEMIAPDYGILTHIGTAHSENFVNIDAIAKEKNILFKDCEYHYTYSDNEKYVTNIDKQEGKTEIEFHWKETTFKTAIPFTDDASIKNAITTICFLLNTDVSIDLIQAESPYLPPIALRLEARKGRDQNVIINDSYSNDLDSLTIALNYIAKSNERSKKVLILSDIQQDKHTSKDLYQLVADLVYSREIDTFYGIGPDLLRQRHLFKQGMFFETVEQFLQFLPEVNIEDSLILLKGARKFEFEKLGKVFEYKSHETKLTIDLDALRNNVKVYQNLINPKTKLLCMVKAFGYGSGSKEIGKILEQCQVDYLGVAYADEGEDLRDEQIKVPIMVMNPEEGSFDKMIANKLEPSIYSFNQLDHFIRSLIDLGIKSYPIHLKIDTGMKRLGFLVEEIEELISTITSQPEVRVKSIFSHLAASDDEREDLFTNKQIQIFQYTCHQIETGLGYNCIKHILNSAGIERFKHAQMDMVRLGMGMYGLSHNMLSLQTVGSLTSVISQIKRVKKGESVGYNRTQFALRDMNVGIVPIGYADGFSRVLSNGKGHVLINGTLAPVFGKVCMDMTMIDLTDTVAKEGDEVEIFGLNRPLRDLADEMDTITYEVMTSVSQRVVRLYVE